MRGSQLLAPRFDNLLLGPSYRGSRSRLDAAAVEEFVPGSEMAAVLPRWVATLLIASLLVPTEFSLVIGNLRLSPYRLLLLGAVVPCTIALSQGRVGKLGVADLGMAFNCLWAMLAHAWRGGVVVSLESGGIYAVESFGAYALGRVVIHNRSRFVHMSGMLVKAVSLMGILALVEMFSGRHFIHDVAGGLMGNRPGTNVEGRFGLARAYGSFDHPILYGTFAAMAFSLAWAGTGDRPGAGLKRIVRGGAVAVATMASLSAGCIMALALQVALIAYRRATSWLASRWSLLMVALSLAYVVVSCVSNRSGIKALLWYLTFDRHTAAYRISIWEHATVNIAEYPLFGVGMENWVRPSWMPQSVDSFWLVQSLSFGLPAVIALWVTILYMLQRVGRQASKRPHLGELARAWVYTFIALLFVGFTVHYWNNVFVVFCFLLGAGGWMAVDGESVTRQRRG